tara:strand:- start:1364 stop:1720 length:357 start_codon:yes stop_codon:yes gene_type:complete
MNIDDIKRRLNNKVNYQQSLNFHDILNDNYQQVEPKTYNNIQKPVLVNKEFENNSSEDELPPESEYWTTSEDVLDIYKPINNIINDLELNNDVYDWRHKTYNGKKSRKNFTQFLVETL